MTDSTQDIPNYSDDKPKIIKLDDNVQCERDIRRFVKKDTGFRKGLPESDKAAARDLLAEWNEKHKAAGDPDRSEVDGWDMGITVPGFEMATASAPTVKPEFAQQQLMARMSKQLDELAEDNKALKAKVAELEVPAAVDPIAGMTIAEMVTFAAKNSIDLGDLTRKDDITEYIHDALKG